ncbi:hypothetical protein [Sulfobacillus thermosulfidooxidans]|uniref:hypothetical protein n=1 Tax=Sulfobacillus thermosulfidooxidans TaxID=28034 RepID=UPI0011123D1B|nr:hypothetical protein [Sulfobacillus thermosulfidooxidans]
MNAPFNNKNELTLISPNNQDMGYRKEMAGQVVVVLKDILEDVAQKFLFTQHQGIKDTPNTARLKGHLRGYRRSIGGISEGSSGQKLQDGFLRGETSFFTKPRDFYPTRY